MLRSALNGPDHMRMGQSIRDDQSEALVSTIDQSEACRGPQDTKDVHWCDVSVT